MLRVRTEFTGVIGGPYLSTMYFSGSDSTAAGAAVAALDTFWSALELMMVNTLSWTTLSDIDVLSDAGALTGVTSATPVSGVGQVSSAQLARQTQGLIRWRTGAIVSGRELRGRTFIPGPTETHNDAGPISTYVTALQSAADGLLGAASTSLIIHSRTHGVSEAAVTGSAWTDWATLRSRRD